MKNKTINFSHDGMQYEAHISEMISFNYALDPDDAPVCCEYTLIITCITNCQEVFYAENMISMWDDNEFIKDAIQALSRNEYQI